MMSHSDSHKSQTLRQLTLRGFDAELERALRDLARETGLSLNRAALLLMRRGLTRSEEGTDDVIGDSLDDFFGVWTREEEKEFLESIEDCERIDPEMWE